MRPVALALAAALLDAGAALAQCTSYLGNFGTSSGDYVNVYSSATQVQSRLSDAAGRWNNGCPRIPNTLRTDEYRNRYGLKGKAWLETGNGRRHPVTIFDIFFAAE